MVQASVIGAGEVGPASDGIGRGGGPKVVRVMGWPMLPIMPEYPATTPAGISGNRPPTIPHRGLYVAI